MSWGDLPDLKPRKKKRRTRRGRVPPTGPYRAESSTKSIREKAAPAETRKLSRGSSRTSKRVRRLEKKDRRPATKETTSRPIETLRRAEEKLAKKPDPKLREATRRLRHALASEALYEARRPGPEGLGEFPDRELRKAAPRAYKKAGRAAARVPSSRGLGEPEDLTTAITLIAPGGGLVGALGKKAAEKGVATVAKEVGTAAVRKAEATAAKTTSRTLNAGSGVRAAGRLAGRGARRAAGKGTSQAAKRKAAKAAAARAARRKGAQAAAGRSRAASAAVPGLKMGKVSVGGLPVARGHVEAAVDSPIKTAKQTAIGVGGMGAAIPKLLASPFVTGGRAVSAAAHEAGVPGARGYTGKEILAPVSGEAAAQLAFARQVAEIVTASDSKEVKRAVEDELGLVLPVMLGLGSYAAGRHVSKGKVTKAVREIANRARKRPRPEFRGEPPRVFEKQGQHKGAARTVAGGRARATREERGATGRYIHEATGAKGGEVIRPDAREPQGVLKRAIAKPGVSHQEAKGALVARPADIIPFATRHSIDLSNPARALEQIKAVGRSLEPVPEGVRLPASKIHTRELIEYVERNPGVLTEAKVRRGLGERRKAGAYRREQSEREPGRPLEPEHSERGRYVPVAVTKRRPLPEHMYPKDVRDIVRAEPKYGVLAKDVLRKESREDHSAAKKLKRQSRTLVRQAERRVEGAKRRTLRAKAAEAEVRGVTKHRVSKRDRAILREQPDYVEAVTANNAAARELRSARREYGNISNAGSLYTAGGKVAGKARMAARRLRAAEEAATATRRQVDAVKADVLGRAKRETSAAARGESATSLATLERGPAGALSRLERAAAGVAKAERNQAKLEAELARAKQTSKERGGQAATLAEQASRKHKAAQGFDPAVGREFVQREAAELTAEGRPQPEYVGTGYQRVTPGYGTTGVTLSGFPGASKMRKGTAEQFGMVEEGLVADIRESFRRPIQRRESYAAIRKHVDDNEFRVGGKNKWTSNEARELFSERVLNEKDWVWVPDQLTNRAYGKFDPETAAAELKLSMEGKAPFKDVPGTKGKLLRREATDEFFNQFTGAYLHPKLVAINRITNFMILSTSPAWAVAQVAAEYSQAALSEPKLLNPKWVKKAIREYEAMAPHKRQAFDSWVGVTRRELSRREEAGLATVESAGDAYTAFHRTPAGRFVYSIRDFDRWKGGRIRTLVSISKIDREMNGHLNSFARGVGQLDKMMETELKTMRGKPLREQLDWIAEHPKLAERHANYLNDVMGDWLALTKNERIASQLMIFYPFLRMSLRWTFYAFPKHHPIRAATAAYIGQQNAVDMKRLLGGDPAYFSDWMKVPVRLGGGEVAYVPVSRLVVGASAPLEALGGGIEGPKGTVALRTVQPVVGAGVTLATGVDPLTGKQERGSGWNALEQLTLGLMAPGRALKELLLPSGRKPGKGVGQIVPGVSTERQVAIDKLAAKLYGYGTSERYLRNLAAPLLPESGRKVADRALLNRIFRAFEKNGSSARDDLSASYAERMRNAVMEGKRSKLPPLRKTREKRLAAMEAEDDEANRRLDALFERNGIPYKKEDRLFLEFYGEGKYPDSESATDKLNKQLGISAAASKESLDRQLGIPSAPSKEELDKQLGIGK